MFIGEKVNYHGPLLVAVPSEGCLGQRVVDQILSSEKSFKFVGSFDHPSLQVFAPSNHSRQSNHLLSPWWATRTRVVW